MGPATGQDLSPAPFGAIEINLASSSSSNWKRAGGALATRLAVIEHEHEHARHEFKQLRNEYRNSRFRIAVHLSELREGGKIGYPAAERAFKMIATIKKDFEQELERGTDPEKAWGLHRKLVSNLSMELVTLRVSKKVRGRSHPYVCPVLAICRYISRLIAPEYQQKAGACKAAHPAEAQAIRMQTLREITEDGINKTRSANLMGLGTVALNAMARAKAAAAKRAVAEKV